MTISSTPDKNRIGSAQSLASALAERVSKSADKPAFIYLGRTYTWRDVDTASSVIAYRLYAGGVKQGTHVGLCSMNSINWVFSVFAIQKLGAVSILINPALRPDEMCQLCILSDVTHLCYAEVPGKTTFELYKEAFLTTEKSRATFDISPRIDFLAGDFPRAPHCDSAFVRTEPDDVAAVIFSSGSTGMPKAILLPSYGLLYASELVIGEFLATFDDINLAFLPLFHIFGFVSNISAPLVEGFVSVIPADKSPKTMLSLIEKHKCTIFNTVPTMLLAMIKDETFSPEKLSTLRISLLGGAATTAEQFALFCKLMPDNQFANIYGMSENAIVSITRRNESFGHLAHTVGKPADNLRLVIMGADGSALPGGSEGEICIRSDSMVVCYYRLPLERQPIDENGWLHTGDLGFLDNDGYLHLTGRIKDLIISGGENISPGEIASVLAALPEVSEIKVLGIPDELMGEIVTAAVVLKPGFEFDEAKVRAYAAALLAKFKLPVHYVVFDRFPILASGKVDALAVKQAVIEQVKQRQK